MNKANKLISLCFSCRALEGEYHLFGCEGEECPFCGGQLSSCECCYKNLGIDVSPGTWAYSNGLTKEQEAQWQKLLEGKGRIPFIKIPTFCYLCGKRITGDELHAAILPNEDWDKYIIPELQPKVLCCDCCNHMKNLFPDGWRHAKKHPVSLIV